MTTLVGVLELNCGKTFGRQVRTTKKEGRLLYGIRHHYKNIPPLKAPYDIRNQIRNGTCSRYVKDKYVVFNWSNDNIQSQTFTERPEVQIMETIGDIDDVIAFSNYRAYLAGFKLTSSWVKELQLYKTDEKREYIINRALSIIETNSSNIHKPARNIFTIDPFGCRDMDDGMGIMRLGNEDDGIYEISIAITHVPSFLVASGMSSEQLITKLINTCSLYMDERVVNMIPRHFAEDLCSLTEGQIKPAMVMTIIWDSVVKRVKHTSLLVSETVYVTNNYVYDSSELLSNSDYSSLAQCVSDMSDTYKRFDVCPTIKDSHDVVAYLMTLMNHYVMEFMTQKDIPCIYRVNRKRDVISLPLGLEHIRRKIGNYAGEYCDSKCVSQYKEQFGSENLTVWTHITSPMRRLADLVNMISLSLHLNHSLYEHLKDFRNYCMENVERISSEYKLSRRLSLDCELFSFVKKESENGSILSEVYTGFVIECDDSNNCMIYVENLSRFFNCNTTTNVTMFQNVKCKIVVFGEGHLINDKVKIVIVEN